MGLDSFFFFPQTCIPIKKNKKNHEEDEGKQSVWIERHPKETEGEKR